MRVPDHMKPRRRVSTPAHLALAVSLFCIWLVGTATPNARAASATLHADAWVTDGPVSAIAQIENTTYIAGSFTYVGPQTGSFAALSRASSSVATSPPKVNGLVRAVVADGLGGWYLGGDFTTVGGVTRNHVAHIRVDGTLDPDWNPNVEGPNSPTVTTLAMSGAIVYIGGFFTSVSGQPRNSLAAVNTVTGTLTNWTPKLALEDVRTAILALLVNGSTVYIGGSFNYINNQTHKNVAAVDATSGVPLSWNPAPNGPVNAFALRTNTLFIGGGFSIIGEQERVGLAAVNTTSGAVSSWRADVDDTVDALAVQNNLLYVGGRFSRIGNQTRSSLAAVDATSGSVTSWVPQIDNEVLALAVSGTTVYIGGMFTQIGTITRRFVGALSTTSGAATTWNPLVNDDVNALAVTDTVVAIGGDFTSAGGVARAGLAALDANGAATAWDAHPDGLIFHLTRNGTTLYVGGAFTHIGGVARTGLAAFDATGAVLPWDVHADGVIYQLATTGTTLYVSGAFTHIGVVARPGLAAINIPAATATTWNPQPNTSVNRIAASATTLYVAGGFTQIGGAARLHVAALDATTGAATAWNPQPDSDVNALAVAGGLVYVGGFFSHIGGQARASLVALDATGVPTAWDAHLSGNVDALMLDNDVLYVGGSLTKLGDSLSTALVTVDTATGAAVHTIPRINGAASALALDDEHIYVGGTFDHIGGQPRSYFAIFGLLGPTTRAGDATNISASATTLTGVVNAHAKTTTVSFAYTTVSGNYSAAVSVPATPSSVTGSVNITVSASLAGLNAHTTYFYQIVATNGDGSDTSAERSFTTLDNPPPTGQPPVITTQPSSQAVTSGKSVTLIVGVSGTAPFSYQWYQGTSGDVSALLLGASGQSYTTSALSNTTSYWVRVTNAAGSADSATAVMTMLSLSPTPTQPTPTQTTPTQPIPTQTTFPTPTPSQPTPPAPTPTQTTPPTPSQPTITSQPTSQTIAAGQAATLTLVVSGTAPFSYQWYQGASGGTHTPMRGATESSYTTSALTDTTSYWVRITNAVGSVDSATVTVTVAARPAQQFVTYLPVVRH